MSINENNIINIEDAEILENTPMMVIEQDGQTIAVPIMVSSGNNGGCDSGGDGIEFYECATYTPEADAYLKYSFVLSGATDDDANTTYERTEWVETPNPDTYEYITTALWTASNGYTVVEECGQLEYHYRIKDATETPIYYNNMSTSSRVSDFNTIMWADWNNDDIVELAFSDIQTEEIPATTEGWTGRRVTQNADGVWVTTEEITTGLTVTHLKPKVGKIFSADTTIQVYRMYDGSVIPIPQDGLVFYAPLQTDYVDMVSGEGAVVTDGTFTEHNGIRCLELDGSGYVKWADSGDVPTDSSAFTAIILDAPTDIDSTDVILGIGQPNQEGYGLSFANGHLQSFGASVTADGLWRSLIVTRNTNGEGKAYLNGVLGGTGSISETLPDPSCICVGAHMPENFNYNATGYVAFAAVYNRELTAEEVAEIHAYLMADVQQ